MSGDYFGRTFPNVPEHEQQHHPTIEPLSPTPTPAPSSSFSPPPGPQPQPLMRRLRTQISSRHPFTRAQAASSRNTNDDYSTVVTDFASPGMPSKRKASSYGSYGVSRKSGSSTPRASASNTGHSDQPILSFQEVLSCGGLMQDMSDAFDGMIDEDSSFNNFGYAIANAPATGGGGRFSNAMSAIRTRLTKPQRPSELIQSNCAILFSYEYNESIAEELNGLARLRYLPICPATTPGWKSTGRDTLLTILSRHRERIDAASSVLTSTNVTWPPDRVPTEMFDLIASHLSRDAVKSMRLVNREFEKKVSCTLFHTSVVPFNTELYDMIDEDTRAASRVSKSSKGKGKASNWDIHPGSADANHGALHWTNAKYDADGKVYKGHGLRVFRGFGPHIRRFGMSFDVLEGQLSRPPIKHELDHVDSYHGSYDWPPIMYTRFANLAGLEKTADETVRMKSAFSHLTNVHDLALSVDSGLGWLNGPDKSIYASVFQHPSPIFGRSRLVPDHQTQCANEFWATIQSCNRSLGPHVNHKEISLVRRPLSKDPSELSGLHRTVYGDKKLWSSIAADRATPTVSTNMSEDLRHGIMYTTFATADPAAQSLYDKSALVPSELRKEQKEWLLETEWAQRAFLECYMLAIMDNPDKFSMVRTLAIAKVSSGLLPLLARESFWDALPNLADVTILVKPNWRSVERDNAGFAETCPQNPSEAVRSFHRNILRDRLCLREGIKKLNVGWAAGGEHADGIFARNNHIMPAPIVQLEESTAANVNSGIVLKYVEHLTLTNCWMTPPMLEDLVKSHAEKNLKILTLDSVSMTAHPRFPVGGNPGGLQGNILVGFPGGAAPIAIPMPQPNGPNMQLNQALLPPPPQWLLPNMPNMAQGNPQQGVPLFNQQQQQAWQNMLQGQGNTFINANNVNVFGGAHTPANNAISIAGAPGHAANVNGAGAPLQDPRDWSLDHREGSWPEVLNKISPGPTLTDYQPQPQAWEEQRPPRAPTALKKIELKSCGYAKLYHSTAFDQFPIEAGHNHHLSLWFRNRQAALSPAMLTTTDRYLGRIVQYMPLREQNALLFAWGLKMGWRDNQKAEEAEYDGVLPGGTGRFSGVIDRDMPLNGQHRA